MWAKCKTYYFKEVGSKEFYSFQSHSRSLTGVLRDCSRGVMSLNASRPTVINLYDKNRKRIGKYRVFAKLVTSYQSEKLDNNYRKFYHELHFPTPNKEAENEKV